MRKSEQRLLDLIRDNKCIPLSPEARAYEALRTAFESANDDGRKKAASASSRHWRRLPSEAQQDWIRLLSGLWRYHSSANCLLRTEMVSDLIIRLGKRTERPALEAEGLYGKGMVLLLEGNIGEAIQKLELSRALFLSRGANRHDSIRVSLTLAEALRRFGDRASAQAVLQRSRRDCLELEDVRFLASVSQGLGILALESGDLPSAIRCFTFVRQSSELLGSKKRSLRAMLGLAISYARSGRLDDAESSSRRALEEATEAQLPREIAIANEYLGDVATRRGRWAEALRFYSRVNKFAITPGASDVRIELHRRMAELWLCKRDMRYAELHTKKGLRLTGDAEDLAALRRLRLEFEWEASRDPEIVKNLESLAGELRKEGLGYEYLLAARSIARIALEADQEVLSTEWWNKASSLAVVSGAGELLRVWRQDRERELQKRVAVDREDPYEQRSLSKLWRELPKIDLERHGIVTRSRSVIEQGALVARVAPTGIPVLITGESGTGKELFASLVHDLSPRNKGPFLAVNCAAMPGELIESELFGHRRGSFTGAIGDKDGLFKSAHRGTMFLDEIGELPTATQSKLLRVLETGEIRRIGDTSPQKVDVRVVAATNLDLKDEVRKGSFRRDLFFRLRGLEIHLPPLRRRLSDIPLLADHFLDLINKDRKTEISLPDATKQWLVGHQWAGNVRELKLSIERAAAIAPPVGPLQTHHFVH